MKFFRSSFKASSQTVIDSLRFPPSLIGDTKFRKHVRTYRTWYKPSEAGKVLLGTVCCNRMAMSQPPLRPAVASACTQGSCKLHCNTEPYVLGGRFYYGTASSRSSEPIVHGMFENITGTWQYVVADPSTNVAVIIDPVLDYEPATQERLTHSADSLLSVVKAKQYKIEYILETHAHADHLTAASYLQTHLAQEQGFKPLIGIGKRIEQVQKFFGNKYQILAKEYTNVFDKLFDDDEVFCVGNLAAKVIHIPGHTPDHIGYHIGDNVFCGDSLFHTDLGSARCDFPGGSEKELFKSARKLLSLPGHVRIWPGHDYPPVEREKPVPWATVQTHKETNKHLRDGVTENEFVALRKERDATLAAPRLLHPSLRANIRAGRLFTPTTGRQTTVQLQ